MVFDKIQSLCPDHFCCHSRKLHKEPFLLSHSHLTTSTFVTICTGTNMGNSNRHQDKSHKGENQEFNGTIISAQTWLNGVNKIPNSFTKQTRSLRIFGHWFLQYYKSKCCIKISVKKCKMVSVFTQPDVNTWEVGRTQDKRRKPRREAKWFPAYRVFSQPPKCLNQAM